MYEKIIVSELPKTWILDLDGTIVKHNGYKLNGIDELLEGAKEFLHRIPKEDMIIFLTSRKLEYKALTEKFLINHNVRWNHIIYEAPFGERILVNDRKPSGITMAYSINADRDKFKDIILNVDKTI